LKNSTALNNQFSIDSFAILLKGNHIVDCYNGHNAPRTKEVRANNFSGCVVNAAFVAAKGEQVALPANQKTDGTQKFMTFNIMPAKSVGDYGIFMNLRTIVQNVRSSQQFRNPVLFCSQAVANNYGLDANVRGNNVSSDASFNAALGGTPVMVDGVQLQVLPSLGVANEFGADYAKIHLIVVDMDPTNIVMPQEQLCPLMISGPMADELVPLYRIKGATR
jgi:hypothetical protein